MDRRNVRSYIDICYAGTVVKRVFFNSFHAVRDPYFALHSLRYCDQCFPVRVKQASVLTAEFRITGIDRESGYLKALERAIRYTGQFLSDHQLIAHKVCLVA